MHNHKHHHINCRSSYFDYIITHATACILIESKPSLQVGDSIHIHEYDHVNDKPLGRCVTSIITLIMHGDDDGVVQGMSMIHFAGFTLTYPESDFDC